MLIIIAWKLIRLLGLLYYDYIQGLKELRRGKIPLQQLWDSCSQNRESVLSGETPGQIAPFASSSDI